MHQSAAVQWVVCWRHQMWAKWPRITTRCLCRVATVILALHIFVMLPVLFVVHAGLKMRRQQHHSSHYLQQESFNQQVDFEANEDFHGDQQQQVSETGVFVERLKWHGRISPNFMSTPAEVELESRAIVRNLYRTKEDDSQRKILIWTPIFGNFSIWDSYIHSPGMEDCPPWSSPNKNGPIMSCSYTFDHSKEHLVDAILFHYIDIDLAMKDLPERRSYQKWLLFVEDPPYLHGKRMLDFEGLFNWTITYRKGSDVQRFFGKIEPRINPKITPAAREQDETMYNTSFETTKERIRAYGPRKLAVWLVSNCITQGRREDFVQELQKYVNVDVYGKCGPHNCTGRMSDECYRHLESRYMFYLAFENSICEDYVTEKFFNSLKYDFVPVVFGGGDYSTLLPDILPTNKFQGAHPVAQDGPGKKPLVYIDALKFQSPRDLAKELLRIAKSEMAYLEYFKWKEAYQVVAPYNWHCDLCRKLHEEGHFLHVAKENLYYWWQTEADCQWWPLRSRGHKPWTWE